MSRVFVTGGSGFVGGTLVRRLVERGDHVVALARSDESARTLSALGASAVVRGDMLDGAALAEGMRGCSLAFHVAGMNSHCPRDPGALMRVNVEGPATAVRAAAVAGVERVVVTSSSTTVGERHGVVGTEDTPHRGSYLSLYDRSKHEGEAAAFAAGRELGIEVVCVCPSSVQGPGRSSGTGAIALAYVNGRLPAFVDVPVSIVDSDDCAEGHLLAASRGAAGERYVLNGATIGSPEALAIVSAVAGVRHRVRMLPPWVARGAAAVSEPLFALRGRPSPLCRARVRTILHGHRYDAARSRDELGLEYRPVAETFERIVTWAATEGLVRQPGPAGVDAPYHRRA